MSERHFFSKCFSPCKKILGREAVTVPIFHISVKVILSDRNFYVSVFRKTEIFSLSTCLKFELVKHIRYYDGNSTCFNI